MTLILTVANKKGISQSSDYQLTANGKFITDKAGTKQIEVAFNNISINLAFTGIAYINGKNLKTVDFLTRELKALPYTSTLKNICKALANICEKTVPSMQPLTLVIAVATIGRHFRIVIISNTNWNKKIHTTKQKFDIKIHTVTKPIVSVEGYRPCVSRISRLRLKYLSKAYMSVHGILESLIEINSTAAKNSKGRVSEKCWVTSFVADGDDHRTASRNIHSGGSIPQIIGGIDLTELIKKTFKIVPGQELNLVQRASLVKSPAGRSPIELPEGEPREFTVSGNAEKYDIHLPTGEMLASITITPIESTIVAKRNEQVICPFMTIEVNLVGSTMKDFPSKNIILTPHVKINDSPTPRQWEQTSNIGVHDGVFEVNFPFTSRGIRNMSFLGADNEMVISVPIEDVIFRLTNVGPALKKVLFARIYWRKIFDDT